MKIERIRWIDIYKGFLIILVVIGHVISSYKGSGITYYHYKIFSSIIYSFHMACFIFISGYLCKIKSDIPKRKQIKHKLISYGIPYVLFSFIWVLFKMFFAQYTNTPITMKDFLLIAIYPISFMWYIYATMIMNIIQIIINNKRRVFQIIVGGIMLISVPIILYYYPKFTDFIICDFMLFWLYFLIGHHYGDRIINLIKNKYIYIISIILFIIFNVLFFKLPSFYAHYCKIITSMSGIIITIGFFCKINNNKIIEYIGKKSLSIYVLQGITIATTRILISKINFLNDVYGIIPLIICTISGIAVPLIIEFISSKIYKLDFVFYPSKYIKTR